MDRDEEAVILVETLHERIRSAKLCLADVTIQNPNVMYELGFAIASGKDVVIICGQNVDRKFPFDIQHRGIISYSSELASDFQRLKVDIVARLKALLRRQATTQDVAAASPVVKSIHGLQPNEVATLALILANVDGLYGASTHHVRSDMDKAGYTRQATQLALLRLSRLRFVEAFEESGNHEGWTAYRLLAPGEDWLVENLSQLEMRTSTRGFDFKQSERKVGGFLSISEDDVPF